MMALTPKQQELADKLTNLQKLTVLGVVAGKSYEDAYKDAKGLEELESPASARAVVSRMLTEANVKAFYDSLIDQAATNAVMSREEALERLSLMGRTRITDIVEFETVEVQTKGKDGEDETKTETIWRLKDSAELNELAASAIKSVTMTKFGPKVELHDAASAITQIAKLQGWEAAQKIEHSGTVGHRMSLDDFYGDPES